MQFFFSGNNKCIKVTIQICTSASKRTIDNYRFRLISLFQIVYFFIRTSHYIRLFKFQFAVLDLNRA